MSFFKKFLEKFSKKKPVEEKPETKVSEGKPKPRLKIELFKKKPVEKTEKKPKVEEKPKEKAKPAITLKIARPSPPEKQIRERGVLTREIYRTTVYLTIEGFVFGSLAALLFYIVLTGFTASPLITKITGYTGLADPTVVSILMLISIGLALGLIGIDLVFKSQKGLGLVTVLSRRGKRRERGVETRLPAIHPGRIILAGISILIPLSGLLIIYMFPGEQSAVAVGSVVLAIGMVVTLYLFATSLKPSPPLPWYAAITSEFKIITPEESKKLAQLVKVAGVTAAPSIIIAKYLALTIILGMLMIPTGVLVGYLIYRAVLPVDIGIGLIAILALSMVTTLYYPYLKFNQLKNERKRAVEKELPFFAIYSSVMQTAGFNIDKAFERMIGNKLFPAMDREARILMRDIRLGTDPIEALTKLALDHPSKRFRDFVFGYTSVLRSGWNTQAYLSMRIREYAQEMKFNWRQYVERAGGIGEMLVTLFLMTTTLFVLIAVVLPYGVENFMSVFNFLILPIVAVLMIQTIDSLIPQPKIKDYFKTNVLIVGAIPLVTLIVMSNLVTNPLYLFASFVISSLLALGIDFQIQKNEIKNIEAALPEFLRDITEYRKIGFPMLKAFFMIKDTNRRYNKYFDKLLSVIVAQLRAGVRLNRVKVPTRSWLGVFVFWLLGEVEDTGGGTPALLEEFTYLVTELLDSRETARKQLRLYDILTFITPVFLIMFVAIGKAINNMIRSVTEEQSQALQELRGTGVEMPIMLNPNEAAVDYAKISVIVASLMLSLTMSKAVDLTTRNTIRPAIVVSLAVLMVALTDEIAKVFVKMVGL